MPFEQPAANVIAQPQNSDSLFDDFWKSALHGAVEAPVTALGQLVDSNFDWEPIKPCNVKSGSVDYFVQGIGGAAGVVTDFATLKSVIGQFGKSGLAGDMHVAPFLRNPLGLTAVSGGLYGGLLTPIDPKYGNQFESRLKNSAVAGLTFTAMEGLSTKLAPLTSSGTKIGGFTKTIGINAGAGIPIGMLNAQAESLLFDHKLAGLNQTAQAGVDWAIIGGVLGMPSAIKSAKSDRSQIANKDVATANGGAAREFKLVASVNHDPAPENQGGVLSRLRKLVGLKDSPPVEWGERPQESAQALGLKLPQMTEQQMALSDSTVLSASRDGRGSMGLEKYLAEVQLPDGTVKPAMIRAFPGGWFSTSRFRHEQAAYHLNSVIGFDNGYPTSALCTFEKNGEPIRAWIQDASGRTFGDGMRRLAAERYGDSSDDAVSQMVKEDPQLRSQVEQAFIERLIYGDRDPSEFNMVFTPDLRVQNIDLDTSFHDYHQPQLDSSPAYGINHRLLNDFRNQPLSGITLGKIDSFVRRYNNPTGHEQLMELGLTSSEATSTMRRAEWFARHKVFPDVKTSIM